MTTNEVLATAADYIEEHGWTRHGLCKDGRVCVQGAIRAVVSGKPLGPLGKLGFAAMRAFMPDRSISAWNDTQKSRHPVIAALREAARRP